MPSLNDFSSENATNFLFVTIHTSTTPPNLVSHVAAIVNNSSVVNRGETLFYYRTIKQLDKNWYIAPKLVYEGIT